MAEHPDVALTLPAPRAAAQISLQLLDAARAASGRLADTSDAEALHDFRVGLRRLRSTFRSFRDDLDDVVPKKLRNRLRDLTRTTSSARDAEVLIAWIERHLAELAAGKRAGISWFVARLREERDRAYGEIRRDVPPRFIRLERRLRKALAVAAKTRAARPDAPSLATRAAGLAAEHAAVLEQELGAIQSARDENTTHAARITAKRLRYLLEPLAAPEARAVLARLKDLQTLLGDLHDLHVLAEQLAEAVGDAAAARARRQHEISLNGPAAVRGKRGPRPATSGLIALAQLVHRAQDDAFRTFSEEWRGKADAELWAALAALTSALTAPVVPIPIRPPSRIRRAPRSVVT